MSASIASAKKAKAAAQRATTLSPVFDVPIIREDFPTKVIMPYDPLVYLAWTGDGYAHNLSGDDQRRWLVRDCEREA